MMQKLARPSTWMLTVLFALLSAGLLYGAPQMANDQMSAKQTVTGCLQKGEEPVGFFIIADGTHWELYPSGKVSLAEHVGHTVTVAGSIIKRSSAQEEKSQPSRNWAQPVKHWSRGSLFFNPKIAKSSIN